MLSAARSAVPSLDGEPHPSTRHMPAKASPVVNVSNSSTASLTGFAWQTVSDLSQVPADKSDVSQGK